MNIWRKVATAVRKAESEKKEEVLELLHLTTRSVKPNPSRAFLIVEFFLLFVLVPVCFRLLPFHLSPLPVLWLAAWYCLRALRRMPGISLVRLWNARALPASVANVLVLFIVFALGLTVAVWSAFSNLLFSFVRTNPLSWALVMALYPILSVCPQGIIYRAFFFERYRQLFRTPSLLMLASAGAFSFSHIIFRNPWSVVLTFAGGLVFAWRYQSTGSLFTSSLEHALYGCLMFTVGLGGLFYHGATRLPLAH